MQDDTIKAVLIAVTFGYKACQDGKNLEHILNQIKINLLAQKTNGGKK